MLDLSCPRAGRLPGGRRRILHGPSSRSRHRRVQRVQKVDQRRSAGEQRHRPMSATTFRCMMRICPVLHRNPPGRRRTRQSIAPVSNAPPMVQPIQRRSRARRLVPSDQPVGSRSAAGTTDTPTSSATYRRQGSDGSRQSAVSAGGGEHDASSFQLGLNPYPFNVALPAGRLLPEVVWDVQHLAGLHQ
jgi:hypothetical protein